MQGHALDDFIAENFGLVKIELDPAFSIDYLMKDEVGKALLDKFALLSYKIDKYKEKGEKVDAFHDELVQFFNETGICYDVLETSI